MSGMRVDRTRRSAKQTITALAEEILRRPASDDRKAKLDLLSTIASRIGWNELFDKIRYHQREPVIQKAHWYQD